MTHTETRHDYSWGEYVYAGHYALLHHVLENHLSRRGVALEFGVGKGESTSLIAEYLPVIGFDSFEGLPEDWLEGFPKGTFWQHTIPKINNCRLEVGLFEDTVPRFCQRAEGLLSVALLHIDCDLYSSTKTVLDNMMPMIRRQAPHRWHGLLIVFDEWHGYEGCEDHEQRAWREFAEENDITWTAIGHSFQQWGIRID